MHWLSSRYFDLIAYFEIGLRLQNCIEFRLTAKLNCRSDCLEIGFFPLKMSYYGKFDFVSSHLVANMVDYFLHLRDPSLVVILAVGKINFTYSVKMNY